MTTTKTWSPDDRNDPASPFYRGRTQSHLPKPDLSRKRPLTTTPAAPPRLPASQSVSEPTSEVLVAPPPEHPADRNSPVYRRTADGQRERLRGVRRHGGAPGLSLALTLSGLDRADYLDSRQRAGDTNLAPGEFSTEQAADLHSEAAWHRSDEAPTARQVNLAQLVGVRPDQIAALDATHGTAAVNDAVDRELERRHLVRRSPAPATPLPERLIDRQDAIAAQHRQQPPAIRTGFKLLDTLEQLTSTPQPAPAPRTPRPATSSKLLSSLDQLARPRR